MKYSDRGYERQFGTRVPGEDHIRQMLARGATRRDVLQWLGACGASAVLAGSLFSDVAKAYAETPKRGGRLRMAYDTAGPNDTLDPILVTTGVDYFRSRMFFNSLTRLTDDLSYRPELAEEILSNDDATVWTFKLRKGVVFHNGKEMTASDVIYSMNRHMGDKTVSKAKSLVSMVERWEQVNSAEVRAVLSTPYTDFPIMLATFHFKIVPEGYDDFSTAVGTGPYRITEFSPGVRSVGVRFDDYWGEEGYLDEMEVLAIGDPVTRLNALIAGDVDAIANLPTQAIPTVEAKEGLEVWSVPSGGYLSLAMHQKMAPSNDLHLVTAMQMLMDRERLLKGVLKGRGALGNDHPVFEGYADFCPGLPQRQLDPDVAKWHLQKSGVGNSKVEIVTAEVAPGAVETCLFLQREAQKIGLNIDVKKAPTDGYYSAFWMKVPFCLINWNMRPTANLILTTACASDAAWNETGWKDDKFDQLLVASRGETDAQKRRQMYCDMQTIVQEKAGRGIPVFRHNVDAVASYVKGRGRVPIHNFGGAESAPFLWRDS